MRDGSEEGEVCEKAEDCRVEDAPSLQWASIFAGWDPLKLWISQKVKKLVYAFFSGG